MSPPRKKTLSLFSLRCGCRDSKSVSVSEEKHQRQPRKPDTDLFSSVTLASSSWEDKDGDSSFRSGGTSPSFSGLLRQLNDLEQSVITWKPAAKRGSRGHRRSCSDGGRVGESVAVVKDSEDPLTDFRRSMLQMIVEKEIVAAEELAELVGRFLSLNSPRHHDVILRAFAEIWNQVFSPFHDPPQFLANLQSGLPKS